MIPSTPIAPRGTPAVLTLFVTLFVFVGCNSSPIADVSRMDLDDVPGALQAAQAVEVEQADDDALIDVIASMLSASKANGLETGVRVDVRATLDEAATAFSQRGNDAPALEELALTELPARISVRAGLRAANLYFDAGERSDAVQLIRKIDQRYPSHAFRVDAGNLLSAIADDYKNDTRRRLFLFPFSNRAPGVYEYLSTEYPTHPKSDDALNTLASIYEENRRFDIAIEKHRDLVLWSPDSPYRVQSEAAIPRLRLANLDGPEYGRDSMLIALSELERWLASFPTAENRTEVERTLVDCLQRLADNDMGVARFYRKVLSVTGARQHAARALEFANRAGNQEQLEEIRAFLETLDEIEVLGAPKEIPEAPSPEGIVPAGEGFDMLGPADLAPGSSTIEARRTPRKTEQAIKDSEDETKPNETVLAPIEGDTDGGNR